MSTLSEVAGKEIKASRDWIRPFLVVATTLLFGSLCFIVAFTKADASDKDLFYMLIGSLNTVWAGSVIGYYFGGVPSQQKPMAPRLLELPEAEHTRKV